MAETCWRTSFAHPYVGHMRNRRHPERTASRRRRTEPALRAQELVAQTDVLIAGLFSAKRKDHDQLMDALAAEVTSRGGRVVGRFVQRRGISGGKKGNAPGGGANMDRPYSARTLMSTGKVEEIAEARATTGAGAVVFFNELTGRQRTALTEIFGCPTLSRGDLPHVRESPTASSPGAHRRTALS
jgi:GTP-binding GTPase N-terminal